MNRDRNALTAGMFILLSLVAAVVVVVLIRGGGNGVMVSRTVTFSLQDDLSGLSVGDDVRLGGVKVGTVRDIAFSDLNAAEPRVMVRFSMPASYPLHEDARIGVQTALTGAPDLNVMSLGSGKLAASDAVLTGAPDPKTVLLEGLRRATPHVEAAARDAAALIKHVDSKIDPVVEKYDAVATRTGDLVKEIHGVVGENKDDLRGTTKNLNVATAAVRDKLPGMVQKVDSVLTKVDGAMINARSALEDIQKTAANAKDLSASARSVVAENQSRIDGIFRSFKATSDNLKETSVEVRHSPWRLLYKPSPEEMGNLNLYDSARQFAEGADSLSDAAGALRDALHDPSANKAQLEKLMNNLDESFRNFHVVEDKLWSSVKQ